MTLCSSKWLAPHVLACTCLHIYLGIDLRLNHHDDPACLPGNRNSRHIEDSFQSCAHYAQLRSSAASQHENRR